MNEEEEMESIEEEDEAASDAAPKAKAEISDEQKRQMNFATPQDIENAKQTIRRVVRYGQEALQAYHFQTFREELDTGAILKNGAKARSYMKRKSHMAIQPDAIREYADVFNKLVNGILKANAQMAGLRDDKADKQGGKKDEDIDIKHLFATGEVKSKGPKKKEKN